MRHFAALSLLTLLLASACTKEDDEAYRPAGITFRTDSGYTFQNDAAQVQDTLLIGALVAEGSRSLQTVYVQMRVNGGEWVQKDSVPFTQNPMALDVQAIMGDVPRSEDWSILAVERSGDATRRSLTFTVTE
ncbi:MAG: hypothetical protein KDB93_09640 [Flavobacteriales bacterium]|nr:hypothetical protein [Flavobacteriales bacterium]